MGHVQCARVHERRAPRKRARCKRAPQYPDVSFMNLPAAAAPPTNVRYGVLGFTCVLSMITYLDRVCVGTLAPYIQDEFGLTETQKGWLFTAFALSYAAFEVPSGWLGDRF